jgi:hypothetical protein
MSTPPKQNRSRWGSSGQILYQLSTKLRSVGSDLTRPTTDDLSVLNQYYQVNKSSIDTMLQSVWILFVLKTNRINAIGLDEL